ncbi:MAG: C39 family peptidase [Eubacterium sp.]|nr:C39 family peptidase [Eubacterium sp.]
MRNKIYLYLMAAAIGVMTVLTPAETMAAGRIATPREMIPKNSNTASYNMTVKSDIGERTYTIFAQRASGISKKSFIWQHGCAVSSLTTVLSAHTVRYSQYTPEKTFRILEKKALGARIWNSNYHKSVKKQRPLSLYGISRVLNYCRVKNRYVRRFRDKAAVAAIKNHLYKGKPVIIEVNNHTQKNGKFSSKYNKTWSLSKHTMVLIGMTDDDRVIVADSATRPWSRQRQRVKLTRMESLVKFMIPCSGSSKSCYYTSYRYCGGYILVQ